MPEDFCLLNSGKNLKTWTGPADCVFLLNACT